ncbi:MAG: patatin-like phospholipase family protein [Bacteroidia bacterium]
MKQLFIFSAFLLLATGLSAQRPKIGISLSGGGAKGLAHIGVLQAIDSAGLQIDYIAGTSMGGVVGALYAVGYSGNAIDSIARSIDWNVIFSGMPDINRIAADKKKENEEQNLEIRIKDRRIEIPSGMLESQELWLLLSELLAPAYNIKNFDELSIPYRCIATDLLTGDAVVHQGGNLVYAVRSSMAIPSVFTAIDLEGRRLIDGGVVRNFPVMDVRDMGADLLIGVNVSAAYIPPEQLNSAISILYQTAFLRSSEDFKNEINLLDLFIDIDTGPYSAASFNSSDSILAIGRAAGALYYPHFKRLADSLNAIYPNHFRQNRLPDVDRILIRGITVNGLEHTTRTAFMEKLGLAANLAYTPGEISDAVREVHASRLYRSVTYEFIPNEAGGASLHFNVQEFPPIGLTAGFHYNTFSNIALIFNLRFTNLLTDKSESSIRLALGDNSHLLLKQEHYLGKRLNNKLSLRAQFDRVFLPEFRDFRQRQLYKEQMASFTLRYDRLLGRSRMTGMGIRYEVASWRPRLISSANTSADNSHFKAFYHYRRHSLPTLSFPSRGVFTDLQGEYVFNQRPFLSVQRADGLEQIYSGSGLNPYFRMQWRFESYIPFSDRSSWLLHSMGGINFTTTDALFDFFNVGGQFQLFRNQIPFAGLREYELQNNSFGMVQAGFQRQLASRVFLIAKFNGGATGLHLLSKPEFTDALVFVWGSSAALGYRSPFGPIDVSLNYNITFNSWVGLLNIGWWF